MNIFIKRLILCLLFVSKLICAEPIINIEDRIEVIDEMISKDSLNGLSTVEVINELKEYEEQYPSEIYNALGRIYLSKMLGFRNVQLSISFLSKSSALGDNRSSEGLGVIYLMVPGYIDYNKSYSNFILAAKDGSQSAMYSIYYLYTLGAVSKMEGLFWLEKSAEMGDSESILFLAKENLQKAYEYNDSVGMLAVLKVLSNVELAEFEGAKDFLISNYYGHVELEIFDFDKSMVHLKLSANYGYPQAIEYLDEYKRLLELESRGKEVISH